MEVEPVATGDARQEGVIYDDCATARAKATQRQAASADSLCIQVTADSLPSSATQRVAIKDKCRSDDKDGVWLAHDRMYACAAEQRTVTAYRVITGEEIGKAKFTIVEAAQLKGDSLVAQSSAEVTHASTTGSIKVTGVKLEMVPCSQCSASTGATSKSGSKYTASGSVTRNGILTNVAVKAGLGWKLTVTVEATIIGIVVNPQVDIKLPGMSYDCDSLIYLVSTGCALGNIPGTVKFSTSKMPKIVAHIKNAQASGLPGKVGTSSVLTRATTTVADQNRAVACPRSLKPTSTPPASWDGGSCDEYPLASSNQGAAANTRVARSFSGCYMADPKRTGSSGFSRCFVPVGEQYTQGGTVSAAFKTQRIQYGHKFRVGFVA